MSSTPYILPASYPSNGPAQPGGPALLQSWLPLAFFTLILALESQAALGADHTSQPLHTFFQSIFGASINQNWTNLHHILRKTGHFLGYGTLSLVTLRSLRQSLHQRLTTLHLHALAIAATFLVASADELHQHFLPNRTGSLHDVLLDCAGAATLQLTLYLKTQVE